MNNSCPENCPLCLEDSIKEMEGRGREEEEYDNQEE